MFRNVFLLLFTLDWKIYIAETAYEDTFKRCCDLGTQWADEKLDCSTFPIPVAGISAEQQAICLSSVEICCVRKHRESQCTSGQLAAKAGKSCSPTATIPGSENFKDCCEGCKMGLLIGSAGGPCDPNQFGPPWDVSFLACCREVISTTESTIGTTTSYPSTDGTSTLGPPSISTSSEILTTPTNTKNKLYPPPPPPLEILCDTLADELCAHICVPVPGSYRCECRRGFTLMEDGKSCQQRDVSDRCKINNPCDQQCFDTGVAVRCSCDRGFKLNADKITCKDIDECADGTHKCDANQVCVNEPGKYNCIEAEDESLPDYEKDKCPLGYKYDYYTHVCDDLDECKLLLDDCGDDKICENSIGSYVCTDGTKTKEDDLDCPPGYYFKAAIESCADIDECASGQDDCNRESQICLNTQGSFTCQNRASKTTCPAGFKINMIGICEDIDECRENLEVCNEKEMCMNELGGYRCISQKNMDNPTSTTREDPEKNRSSAPTFTERSTTTTSEMPSSSVADHPYPSLSSQPPTLPQPSSNPVSQPFNPQQPHQPIYHYVPPRYPYAPESSAQPQACKPGFIYITSAERCIDIDECLVEENACDSNQECINTIGSFNCICKSGFHLDSITGACIDVNECQTGSHDCVHSQRCDNTIGSFHCVRFTSCGTGYTLNAASGLCEDDDECTLETHDCKILGPHYECKNTLGSYRCMRKRCISSSCHEQRTIFIPTDILTPLRDNEKPLTTIQVKKCLPGYIQNNNGYCDDVNECQQSPCAKHQQCINTNGSYRCLNLINCSPGYKISDDGLYCEDIDECETGTHKCTGQQQCINRDGFYICQCPPGHQANKANQCEDINECEYFNGKSMCSHNAECENTIGSYKCRCKQGLRETNNGKTCKDIDECKETSGLCQQTCVNVWGSYRCACEPGFTLNSDNRSCSDVDECEKFQSKHLCIGICENTPGSYSCRCPEGYRLGLDGRACQDIDECQNGNICPRPNDVCFNIRGSYRCNSIQCPKNYVRDSQKNRCKRKTQYCNIRDTECMRQPTTYSHNFITFVSRLPLPEDGHLDLFNMRGPQWDTTTTFNMDMLNVRCPHSIPKVDKSYFHMRRSSTNEAVLSLIKMIDGPQEAELQLTMEVYHHGEYKGSAVAKVFIIVSQYEF